MDSLQVQTERRKNRRVKVQSGTYAINSAKPGLIGDISVGGLSFRYIDRKEWPEETFTLDIVYGEDEEFRLDNLPYRVVSDYETKSDIANEKMTVKRRSIAFGEMSQEQRQKLQQFINLYQAAFN